MTILVTGATGRVGRIVARELVAAGERVRLAARRPDGDGDRHQVALDFTEPATWPAAFDGVRALFLVRPPAIGNVRRDLLPAMAAARDAGVEHVVFLSLQGVEKLRGAPHALVERWLAESGMSWTFVRASFFHQNLLTPHGSDIRDRDELVVPAGTGRTAFVDAEDVGAVAAAALLNPGAHAERAWTVTGSRALDYHQVVEVLSAELGRPIRYREPSVARYVRHARRHLDMPWPMVAVTTAIYTSARLGLAAGLTDDVETVLGRAPIDLADFARRERAAWS
ncbi:NmrA family NAD(P)-binding protein [Granulicoccus sp. GXG6511]|uniref:NmrA family NAD(P)-binding protein n=1 Tax=Granulicoccus sp. GXG6511 TaxID=3381351 RepID=UPI003D7D5871